MEIHNHGNNLKAHIPVNQRSTSNVDSGSGVDQTEQVKPQRLLERLDGDAKVRERLLVEIEAKVQTGEYMTQAAAVNAAQHIVDL